MTPLSPQDQLDLKRFIQEMIQVKDEQMRGCWKSDPTRASQLRKDKESLRSIYARFP